MLPAAMLGMGAIAAAVIASLPQAQLDLLSWRLWLPAVLPAAAPPVGVTGRILLAVATLALFAGIGAVPLLLRWRESRRGMAAAEAEDAVLPWLVDAPAQPAPRIGADRSLVKTTPKREAVAHEDDAKDADAPAVSALARLTKRLAREMPRVEAQAVRRADSHPDAPPRRPIMASEDLGPPLPIVAAPATRRVPEPERPLPADLDVPLAAFDPCSLPNVPREPVRAVAPLTPPPAAEPVPAPESAPARPAMIDPGEHFETLAVPAPIAGVKAALAEPIVAISEPDPVATEPAGPTRVERPDSVVAMRPALKSEPLAALLERLERGASRRAAPEPPRAVSLDDTLVQLRRLATG